MQSHFTNPVKKIVVTNALPYTNGHLHLGHLVGFLQADFWKSFLKLKGCQCIHICGSDVNGTPIMLHAQKLGTSPEDIWKFYKKSHLDILNKFHISFDVWSDTAAPDHIDTVRDIYEELVSLDLIYEKDIYQFYDEEKGMFLSDRMVKGTCPFCKAIDQNGDLCEVCGKSYAPADLIKPTSSLSGNVPVLKESSHLFFKISQFKSIFSCMPELLSEECAKYMSSWSQVALEDWCITRDSPYHGIEVPNLKGKYFYVWFEAIISYISFQRDKSIWKDTSVEIYQFIGKDILYFHALFWASILKATGRRLPNKILVNGFLLDRGRKLSKSKGDNLRADKFLEEHDPDVYRFFVAKRSFGKMSDLHFNLEEMKIMYNSLVIGQIVNVASRTKTFFEKHFDCKLNQSAIFNYGFRKLELSIHSDVTKAYEQRKFGEVISIVESYINDTNKRFSHVEPWHLIKKDPEKVHELCTVSLQQFYNAVRWLRPILPNLAKRSKEYLNDIGDDTWDSCILPLTACKISKFKSLSNIA